jgi:fucose permease
MVGSLQIALIVPALCYMVIAAFGLYTHRNRASA